MEFMVTVSTVAIMLLYSLPGYALVKCRKIAPTSISAFATVLMYVCQSCLVVYSFQKVTYTPELFRDMLIFFAITSTAVLVVDTAVENDRSLISGAQFKLKLSETDK